MPDEAKIHCLLQSYVLQSPAIYFCKATAWKGIIFMNIYIHGSSADLRGYFCYVVQRQSDAAERPIFPGFDGADVGPLRQQVQELSKYDVSVCVSLSFSLSLSLSLSLPPSPSLSISLTHSLFVSVSASVSVRPSVPVHTVVCVSHLLVTCSGCTFRHDMPKCLG
jgi:hypothetical protein